MSKLKLEDIIQELSEQNWKVKSDRYEKLESEMEFECPEGHQVFTSWKKLRGKYECPLCKQNSLLQLDGEILSKPKDATRVLSIDQASHVSGYAIFDNGVLIKYGKFETNHKDEMDRYMAIKSWLLSMITNWRPDYIGLEGIQYQDESSGNKMGITVFQTLARLQGILMLVCYEQKIPFEVCMTNTWRHACGVKGKSRADRKRSMQMLVKQWYDISVGDDESDAIGIGHYLTERVNKMVSVENWEI